MRKILLALAGLLLVACLALAAWLLLRPVPVESSGWLCCYTAAGSQVEICVQVKGIDSECDGGSIGWCENISEDATGQADCLD
jgi:hypothetical protein